MNLSGNVPLLVIGGLCLAVVAYLYRELQRARAALHEASPSDLTQAPVAEAAVAETTRRRVRFADDSPAGDSPAGRDALPKPGEAGPQAAAQAAPTRGQIGSSRPGAEAAQGARPSRTAPRLRGPPAAAAATPAAFESAE